jgi:pyruvate/2-oxoglutarate dehydrogenase complex dihydrolipoamide dehydrogenase (E3) component
MVTLPKYFLFIGGGPVSMEMGQAFYRLGSKVTVVDQGNQILNKEDLEISTVLRERLEKEGMMFHLNSEVHEINAEKNAIVKTIDGKKVKVPVDAIFMGLGRVLNFNNLDLEKAQVKLKEDGTILIDNKLRTSNKHIFVSGDAANNLMFSHAAEMHTKLLLNNFLSPLKKIKYRPFCLGDVYRTGGSHFWIQ